MGSSVSSNAWAAKVPSVTIARGEINRICSWRNGLHDATSARSGVRVFWGRAFQDVGDVDVLPRSSHRFDDLRQELPGPADEREALLIFVAARGFPDEHEIGVRGALAEDDVRARPRELAAGAAGDEGLERGKVRHRAGHERWRRTVCHASKIEVGDTEVAEVGELLAERETGPQASVSVAAGAARRARNVTNASRWRRRP